MKNVTSDNTASRLLQPLLPGPEVAGLSGVHCNLNLDTFWRFQGSNELYIIIAINLTCGEFVWMDVAEIATSRVSSPAFSSSSSPNRPFQHELDVSAFLSPGSPQLEDLGLRVQDPLDAPPLFHQDEVVGVEPLVDALLALDEGRHDVRTAGFLVDAGNPFRGFSRSNVERNFECRTHRFNIFSSSSSETTVKRMWSTKTNCQNCLQLI